MTDDKYKTDIDIEGVYIGGLWDVTVFKVKNSLLDTANN